MYEHIASLIDLHCSGDPTHPQVPSATQGAKHNGANLPKLLEELSVRIPLRPRLQRANICIPFSKLSG